MAMTTRAELIAEIDALTHAGVAEIARSMLHAGYRHDELPVILRPWVEQLVAARARALARLDGDRVVH